MHRHKHLYADQMGSTPTTRMEEEARKSGHGDTRFNFKHKKRISSTCLSDAASQGNKSVKGHDKKVRLLDDEPEGAKRGRYIDDRKVKKGSQTIEADRQNINV